MNFKRNIEEPVIINKLFPSTDDGRYDNNKLYNVDVPATVIMAVYLHGGHLLRS